MNAYDALSAIASDIKASAESELLLERYLSGFETAKALEPESVKIVVAVKEVIEDALDDHENAYLQADSLSIQSFPSENIIPFLKEVEKRGVENIPIDPIRRRREQLKHKLELQKRNVNVHLQRVQAGLGNMSDGTYYLKTNHLPAYAAATALEVLLRAYWVLMGRLDGEDPMVEFDCEGLERVAREHAESLRSLLEVYRVNRLELVNGRLE